MPHRITLADSIDLVELFLTFYNIVLTSERHQHILRLLESAGHVSLRTLRAALPVTDMTLWRDLLALETQGRLRRIRGGAERIDRTPEPPFGAKLLRALPQKRQIAARAAELFVNDGDLVFLEGGTTVAELLPYFRTPGLTVATNSLQILTRANAAHRHVALHCSGGVLNPVSGNFVGPHAVAFFQSLRAQTFFMSGTGLSLGNGQLTDPNPKEIEVKLAMAAAAKRIVLLLDSTKMNIVSSHPVLRLGQVDAVVTDRRLSADAKKRIARLGPALVLA